MRCSPRGFWQALEIVPGLSAVAAEWQMRIGEGYEPAKPFLRPSGKLASSHPCTEQRPCECAHEVVEHGLDDIVAVCRCGRGCTTFPLNRSEIAVYELDRTAFDQTLAGVFNLMEEPDPTTGLHQTTRIGVYSPYAGFRFPVYLTIQLELDDFHHVVSSLVSRTDEPFILIAPTHDLCTAPTERMLASRKSAFVPLEENIELAVRPRFRLLRPLDDILSSFQAANLPAPENDGSLVFFPTPPDSTWEDVAIRFVDGHTVSIKVKSEQGVFNYTQMGMASQKDTEPTVQWDLLGKFAEEYGVLDWNSHHADRRNQKRRENLARNLRSFFRIEGDPFHLTDDGKGWQARFQISPDE